MTTRPVRILIVDDNEIDRELYRRLLSLDETGQYEIVEAGTGAEGVELCERTDPDCVLLDQRLPDCDGTEVIGRLLTVGRDTTRPVVMMSGQWDGALARTARELGACELVEKGVLDAESLAATVRRAIGG